MTSNDAPSCRNSAGKFVVWTARSGVGASVLWRSGSSIGPAGEPGVAMISTFHTNGADLWDPERNRDRVTHENVASDQARK